VPAPRAAQRLGPLRPAVTQVPGTSRYRAELQLLVPGTWLLEVSLPSQGFDPLRGSLEVEVSS